MMRRFRYVLLLAVLLPALHASAAGLGLGALERDGDYWVVPVGLLTRNGETVASLQFELYPGDSALLVDALAGDAAQAAGKDVIFAQRGEGIAVIVAGLNQNAIPSGVVAWAVFAKKPKPQPYITNVILSDPRGQAVTVDPPDDENNDDGDDPDNGAEGEGEKSGTPVKEKEEAENADDDSDSIVNGGAFPTSSAQGQTDVPAGDATHQQRTAHSPANDARQGGHSVGNVGSNQSGEFGGSSSGSARRATTPTQATGALPTTPILSARNTSTTDAPRLTGQVSSDTTTEASGAMEAFRVAQSSGTSVPPGGHSLGARATRGKALLPESDAPTSRRTGFGILLLIVVPILVFTHRVVYGKRKKRF